MQLFAWIGVLLLLCGGAGLTVPAVLYPSRLPQRLPGLTASLVEQAPFEEMLKRFAPAAELPELRTQLAKLEQELADAIDDQNFAAAATLRDDVSEMRGQDPAVLAAELRAELHRRLQQQQFVDAARCRDQLLVLKRFLPQYQLAGLWKGNYPTGGEALIRLRYEGDTLFATKVTGDGHVPAGEITFQADLTTPYHEATICETGNKELVGVRVEVVSLSSDGAQQQREVERYQGEGRIAAQGFEHAHFVPGQLFLMDNDVVGFLWLPLGTFVVFSRVDEMELDS